MNHLVGVAPKSGSSIDLVIHEDEREPLAAFKAAYLALKDSDRSDPAWQVEPDSLPASGWRPLDDVTLLRFLRADKRGGKLNPEAGQQRLLHALLWRKNLRADRLLREPPHDWERFTKLRVRRWAGVDNEGRPVQFERLGKFMGSGNAKAYSNERWLELYARDMETTFSEMRAAAQVTGKPIINYTYCGDLSGMGGLLWHLRTSLPLLKFLTKEVEVSFPEIVNNIIVFNAPRIFASLFPMVKVFMDPLTAAKVEVHAGVPTERFKQLMPASVLPKEYGGEGTVDYPQTEMVGGAGAQPSVDVE